MFKKLFGKSSQSADDNKPANPFQPSFIDVSKIDELKSGDLLVAKPFFQDPRFDRSVMILTGSSETHLVGAVVTRPTEELVAADFPILKGNSARLNWGGPVNESQLYCLHRLEKSEDGIQVLDDLVFEPDMASFLDKHPVSSLNANNSFFFKGLVQWDKQQLNGEISGRDWAFSRGEINLFDFDNSGLWQACFPGFETLPEAKIFPRLKAVLPQSPDSGESSGDTLEIPADQQPISREVTDDLMLFYVEDTEAGLIFLNANFFDRFPAFTSEYLERLAIQNLIHSIAENVQMRGSLTDVVMITAGGNYEASLVMVEGFMEQMHLQFGGDLVIGIPAQDLLFLTHASNDEGREKIQGLISQYFENPETQGLLSNGLYLRKKGVNTLERIEIA